MAPNTVMIDHEYSTGSTSFLGFGSSILGGRKQRDPDVQSIISVASGSTALGVKSRPAAGSDTSSSSGGDDRFDGPSEFVVECKYGEMVFESTPNQRKAEKMRCDLLRLLCLCKRQRQCASDDYGCIVPSPHTKGENGAKETARRI
jgi:hypothetical protein